MIILNNYSGQLINLFAALVLLIAFAMLVINLLGVGPGPLITGMIGDARGLTLGLLSSLLVAGLAIPAFALAARRARSGPATPALAAWQR